jgi:hypothetical protein
MENGPITRTASPPSGSSGFRCCGSPGPGRPLLRRAVGARFRRMTAAVEVDRLRFSYGSRVPPRHCVLGRGRGVGGDRRRERGGQEHPAVVLARAASGHGEGDAARPAAGVRRRCGRSESRRPALHTEHSRGRGARSHPSGTPQGCGSRARRRRARADRPRRTALVHAMPVAASSRAISSSFYAGSPCASSFSTREQWPPAPPRKRFPAIRRFSQKPA